MKEIQEDLFKQIVENMPISCVDLIILNKGKVLLIYRKDSPAKNQWWTPSGRQKKKEKIEQTVIRKAKEEVGLDVSIKKFVGVYDYIFEEPRYQEMQSGDHGVTHVYIVGLKDSEQKATLDQTSTDFKWIDKIEEGLHKYIKQSLKDSKVFDDFQ